MIDIINIITNADNSFNFDIIFNNRILKLHSSRPIAEAQKIFSNLPQKENALYFIGGLGLGYLLEKIICETEYQCLVYEPDSSIFKKTIELRPELQQLLLNNSRVFFVQNLQDLQHISTQLKINDVVFNIHRPYAEIFPKEFLQAKEIIAGCIRKQEVGVSTIIRFSKTWTKNIFKNMHRYFTGNKLIHYKNACIDQPAVIIGAGSSLEQALPYIKQYQDQMILIACDTTLPILSASNISPDFVVTVDAQEKNAYYLRYSQNKNHILIADPGVHDSSFEDYDSNNIILMDSFFPFYPFFEKFWGANGLLSSGGSVSTSAFDLARQLGCNPIIMAGQDLSFSNNKTHSQGNILAENNRIQHHRLSPFHTQQAHTTYAVHSRYIKGRKPNSFVLADARFIIFKEWFEEQIVKTSAEVIIAGMDGAYLEGATHKEISKAFELLPSTRLKKNYTLPITPIADTEYHKYLDTIYKSICNLLPICQKSLTSIKQSYKNNNPSQAAAETTKLQKILNTENSEHSVIAYMVSTCIQDSIHQTMSANFDQTSPEEQQQLQTALCTDIVKSLKLLKNQIHKAQYLIKKQTL
ncbi:MAG: motility associated factor glycosyltransferase family protein [Brevinemataceae bacterium]